MRRSVTRLLNFQRLRIAIGLVVFGLLSGPPRIVAQTRSEAQFPAPAADTANQSPFKLQVRSNLVVVRVVVHDAHGNPVDNLRKEDFRLFDSGKEQAIAQFEMKAPAADTSAPIQPSAPAHFIALFFDDLNTPLSYL